MSRAIQVRVSESLTRTIHVEDGIASPLEMLPILAPDRMAELLAAELIALGFVRDGGACKRTEPDGTEIVVDLAAATVAVKLAATATLDRAVDRVAMIDEERREQIEARLRTAARAELDQRIAEEREVLRREVTAQLEAKLADLKRELDGAIGRATIAALTEKAAQLGHIEETHRDEAGNVTIRVRV